MRETSTDYLFSAEVNLCLAKIEYFYFSKLKKPVCKQPDGSVSDSAYYFSQIHLPRNRHRRQKRLVAKKGTVCFSSPENVSTVVGPPEQYLAWKKNPKARVKTANIVVDYTGFTTEAQAAFQAAVDIWETLISSPVTIRISANWETLGTNVLGSATPYTYYRNFDGAQKLDIWYPIALAEKMAGKDLNDTNDPDIYASFNSAQAAWYFGTGDPANKYDLTSVVLHEIGHGLGITHSYEVSSGTGQIQSFFVLPVIYETFLQNASGKNLVENFTSPSTTLGTQLTSGNLFFNSPSVAAVSSNLARIYAPATYTAGSSIAHLNESTYPAGDANSLMTPSFSAGEINHNPGPLAMAMLNDMGWNEIHVTHTAISNTETVNQDFNVVCQIVKDTNYDPNSVKLTYTINSVLQPALTMTATSNADEFSVAIPKPVTPSVVTDYAYYISVNDNSGRSFSSPGKVWTQGTATHTDGAYAFQAGPDKKPPHITHTPVTFIKATDTQLPITAILTDNIGINSAAVQYKINGTLQSDVAMAKTSDSTYKATLNLTVVDGDVISYRIKVIDSSVAQNESDAPSASTFYLVNVVGLLPTQDNYSNNFNSTTTDFFGDNLFSVFMPSGFNNGCINTSHPYPASDPKDSISYVYQLRVPIKLKASTQATLKFDEIVLVEPGEAGSTWPDPGKFYDYVIVEGSKDGGVTWRKLINGYDCRDQSVWLSKWKSSLDANQQNSLAVGDPSLYKTRTLNMLTTGYFKAGDEIVIRFRLMSDQLADGWGWAIDNLKIQIDETPPTILHNLVDFVYTKTPSFDITVTASDASGLQSLSVDYSKNNGSTSNSSFTILPNVTEYTLNLSDPSLKDGDEVEYRINATDNVGNSVTFPSTGFFKVAALNFKNGVKSYTTDFNTTNTDFVGNFFSVNTATGFSNPAINSAHPYQSGFGLDNTTDYSFILKNPIVLNSASTGNTKMIFSEVLIAESGTSTTKDYAVVEGSKDKGVTWHAFLTPYSSSANAVWQNAYSAGSSGASSMFKTKVIDLTQSGDFVAGDSVVIRFRFHVDAQNSSWGWAIDDLSIQGTITALEDLQNQVSVYPNPVSSDYINLSLPEGTKTSSIEVMNSLGQLVSGHDLDSLVMQQQIYVGNLHGGVYLLKINVDEKVVTKKIIVSR